MRRWDAKMTRISLDLDPDELKLVEELVQMMRSRTKARLIRQALRFYRVLAHYKQEGYTIQAIRGGSLYQFPELDVPYGQPIDIKKKG